MAPKERVDVVDVVRHGEKLILPDNMTYIQAIKVLQRQMEYEEEVVAISESIDAFPWDGAIALNKALQRKYGWATAEPTPGFFGPNPPQLISVEVEYGKTQNVVWGRFSVPGIEGYLQCGTTTKDNRVIFRLGGEVKRKFEPQVKEIAELVRKIVREESIYRGQPVRMRFKDDDGNPIAIPTPTFLDVSGVKEHELIFPDDVMRAVRISVFTPIERTEEARRYGIPRKRGVLAEGPYGVGKTLLAYVTAKKAKDNGWTYIYLERADELPLAVRFAHQYQPAVIFTEDIDRVVTGERSIEMDEILNTIDGIDSKNTEIMVVLTTNHVENINQAMLRPGRLDAVISVRPPDANAAIQLVRLYGRGLVAEDENLAEVGKKLAGKIPAVIREVVERSKMAVIDRIRPNEAFTVTAQDLIAAADAMNMHLQLLEPRKKDERHALELFGHALVQGVEGAVRRVTQHHGVNLREIIADPSQNGHAPAALPAGGEE